MIRDSTCAKCPTKEVIFHMQILAFAASNNGYLKSSPLSVLIIAEVEKCTLYFYLAPNGIIPHFEMSVIFKPVYGALKVENIWTPRDDPSFDGLLANRIVMGFSVTAEQKCDISLSQKAL